MLQCIDVFMHLSIQSGTKIIVPSFSLNMSHEQCQIVFNENVDIFFYYVKHINNITSKIPFNNAEYKNTKKKNEKHYYN